MALILAAALLAGCATSSHESHAATAAVKPYPLDKCVVSGEAFGHGEPYTFVRNGQQIKLCCEDCLTDFNKNPEKYLAKINEAQH